MYGGISKNEQTSSEVSYEDESKYIHDYSGDNSIIQSCILLLCRPECSHTRL